jgi:hypothetical protein
MLRRELPDRSRCLCVPLKARKPQALPLPATLDAPAHLTRRGPLRRCRRGSPCSATFRRVSRLLVEHGVDPTIARCCLSHARWAEMDCSLGELLVALADKLWKGARHAKLERRVIDGVAGRLGRDFWNVFVEVDTVFEEVAAGGEERLARSR